jgi:tetratricopeptide (TPR) repeat protein
VLEALLFDCKRWVEAMEKSVKDKTSARIPLTPRRLETTEPVPEGEEPNVAEGLWRKRNRLLAKSIALSFKLADLYADDHVMKQDLAHKHLTWAVETALKELQRRKTEGVKDGEGKWLSSEEMGANLEALGLSYESKSQFHLALPLFFQALGFSDKQCHSAVLMNNIATCFAQHPIMAPGEAPVDAMMGLSEEQASASPEVRKAAYLAAAHRWATNANQHATEPQGEKRTDECDEACAVSLCNLADIASLAGRPAEARKRYEQAIALSKKIGFTKGIAQAEAGLHALPEPTS